MNRDNISVGEYYHIFNRGVGKKIIFKDDRDRIRFLFLILYFQAENNFPQISTWKRFRDQYSDEKEKKGAGGFKY